MSDIQLPTGFERVELADIYKNMPEGFKPIKLPTFDLSSFDDPEQEAARLQNSAFVADHLNVDISEAHEDVDEYIRQMTGEEKPPHKKFSQELRETWNYGQQTVQLGKARWRQMLTIEDEETNLEIENLKSQMIPPAKAERSLPAKALLAATEMTPIMLAGIKRGAKTGLLAGAGGAAVAALVGQAGPQVALPEEIVTVPGAFLTLFSIGMMTGSTQEITEIEGGLAYDEMLGMGIDPQIAKPIGIAVGVINGLIETVQISELLSTIPGGKALFRKAVTRATKKVIAEGGLKKIALRFMGQYGKHIALETSQEITQEVVAILGEEIAKEYQIRRPGARGVAPVRASVDEIIERLKDTAIQSALAFSVMAFPGTSTTAISEAIQARKVETKVETKAEGRVEETPEQKQAKQQEEAVDVDLKYTKALKTKDGKIHTDPNANYHVEIAELRRIDPMDVAESGRVIKGRYLREDQFLDWVRKGEKTEDLPPVAKSLFKQRVTEFAPQVTEEQAEAITTLVETQAESEGLSFEEYTQKYFAPEIVTGEVPPVDISAGREISASEEAQTFFQSKGLEIDPDTIPRSVLSLMNRTLRSKGYDVRGADDLLYLMKERGVWRDGVLWQPDWIAAYEKATESREKTITKKAEKADYQNINWEQIKKLGLTGNLKEAGYIRPDGMLNDFSGKRIGGIPGSRDLDHREAGGTDGMQELVACGYIRMDYNSGSLDIGKEPTSRQYTIIEKMATRKNGEIVLDLADGLGEYDEANQYYRQPERVFYREYPEGTKSNRIVNDIKRFFSGQEPIALFQAGKGAVSFVDQGKALIHATEATDFSTFVHEMGHVWRRQLTGDDLRTIEEWVGVKRGEAWNRAQEEQFANGLEQYLRENQAPSTKLATLFDKFKQWLQKIYDRFAKMSMSDNVRRAYEGLFLSPEEQDRRLANKPFTEEELTREGIQAFIGNIKAKEMVDTAGLNRAQINSVHRTERYGLNDRAYQYWKKLMQANPAKYRKIQAMLEGDYEQIAFWEEQGYTIVQPGDIETAEATEAKLKEEKPVFGLADLEEQMAVEAEKQSATMSASQVASKIVKNAKKVDTELVSSYKALREVFFGNRDEQLAKAKIEHRRFHRQYKEVLGKKRFDKDCELLGSAIQFYIDSKINPERVEQFYKIVNSDLGEAKGIILKIITGREELAVGKTDAQLEGIYNNLLKIKPIIDRATNLTAQEIIIAEQIAQSDQEIGRVARDDAEIIYNTLENHMGRVWDLRGKEKGPILRKFGTTTHHAKHRVFDTILEGYFHGYKLKVFDSATNLQILKEELIHTIANKQFLKSMLAVKDVDGNPLLSLTWDKPEGYEEVMHPRFLTWAFAGEAEKGKAVGKNFLVTEDGVILEKRRLYAPKEVARNLNNVFGTSWFKRPESGSFGEFVDAISKFNSILKRVRLIYSLFHPFAFLRSYYLPTGLKTWKELNPISANRAGIRMVEEMHPQFMLLVRNGLTFEIKQDWDEMAIQEGTALGKVLDKIKPAQAGREFIRQLHNKWLNFVFGTMGTGYKVMAAVHKYVEEQKLRPNEDPNVIAREVAGLINDDFGGLHLQRMGRNPTLQHVLRILFLAPDWTESNVRSMLKVFGVSTDRQQKITPAQRKMFAKFWARAMIKGMAATVFFNFILAGGDPERFLENYRRMWRETIKKSGSLRIFDIDITPIYRAFGGRSSRRKYWTLIGHFRDPVKFAVKFKQSAKHKASMFVQSTFDFFQGEDWAGRRFTKFSDLVRTGKTVDWRADEGLTDFAMLPSYIINQIIGWAPIPIANLIAWINGEMEAFDAIANSLGFGVRTTY